MTNNYINIVGNSFEDMSTEEMALMQGLGDIEGRKSSTPVFSKTLGCGAAVSAATAIVASWVLC